MDIEVNMDILIELCKNYGFKYNKEGYVTKSKGGYHYKVLLIGTIIRKNKKKNNTDICNWDNIDDVLNFIK